MTVALSPDRTLNGISKELQFASQSPNYIETDQELIQLLASKNLDQQVNAHPEWVSDEQSA
jgi:hypothetical protein